MDVKYATARNKANDREVRSMFSKAMCAYANWQDAIKQKERRKTPEMRMYCKCDEVAHQSEYEATVRCLSMLTVEHLPEVCILVIDACKLEFGI